MLKIGLLGYGKMGKAIEQLAENQGIEIVWRISRDNLHERNTDYLRAADVVIEFSRPEAAFENVMACLEAGVPVISGTTGWMDDLPAAQSYCEKTAAPSFGLPISVLVSTCFLRSIATWQPL